VGGGDQPGALDAKPMSRTPEGMLWCHVCRRTHPVPVCEVCGVELRDLPHRLVMVCEPCKAVARTAHAGAVRRTGSGIGF
jgi:ribosomal protein L34E